MASSSPVVQRLLAVDLGLRVGLCCVELRHTPDGANDVVMQFYRSQHFANVTTMKAAIPAVLQACAPLHHIVVEGDRHLGDLWSRLAIKRGARLWVVRPEEWRASVLLPREQTSGVVAKKTAVDVARGLIAQWHGKAPRTALNDDVAEAICLAQFGVLRVQEVEGGRRAT